jgi:hypothetical protein
MTSNKTTTQTGAIDLPVCSVKKVSQRCRILLTLLVMASFTATTVGLAIASQPAKAAASATSYNPKFQRMINYKKYCKNVFFAFCKNDVHSFISL